MADFLDLMNNSDKLLLFKELETYYRQNMFWRKLKCVKYIVYIFFAWEKKVIFRITKFDDYRIT